MANEDGNVEIPQQVREQLERDAQEAQAANGKTTETTPEVTAPTTSASQQTDRVQKFEYPSEVVDLPSEGWFYDPTSQLQVAD